MASGVFNVALGRVAEYHERVNNNDPVNSALVIVWLSDAFGAIVDATLRDFTSLGGVFSIYPEFNGAGYAPRKVLTDTDIAAITVDQANDRVDADITADPVWAAVSPGAGAPAKLLVCYDPDSTTGTDGTIIPLTFHDFVVTPNGGSITAQIAAAGYYRAA